MRRPPHGAITSLPVRLLVVEDLALLRAALVSVLSSEVGFEVVAALLCDEARASIDRHDTDIAVVGIDTSTDECLTTVREMRRRKPLWRVVALTVPSAAGVSGQLLDLGVPGLIDKHEPVTHLVAALRVVAEGGKMIDASLITGRGPRPNPFTAREREVLRGVATGATAAEIAEELSLSPGTVRNYLASAMSKTGTHTRIDAIRVAEQAGWL